MDVPQGKAYSRLILYVSLFGSAHHQLGYLAVYRTGTKRSRASIRKRSMSSLRDTESGTVWWSSSTLATFISFLSLVADSIANLRK